MKTNKPVETIEQLVTLIEEKSKMPCGYNSVIESIADILNNTAWLCSRIFGITGFQASCIGLAFLKKWSYDNNKCGFKIVNYDDLLFPQYEYKLDKIINIDTWNAIQKEAKELLLTDLTLTNMDVIRHWQSIVDGKIPFGYKIKDND